MAQSKSSGYSSPALFPRHAKQPNPTSMEPSSSVQVAMPAATGPVNEFSRRPEGSSPRSTPRLMPGSLPRQGSWPTTLPDSATVMAHSPAQRTALPRSASFSEASSGCPPTALVTTIPDSVYGRGADDEKPIKRRMRGITSCLECRRRKTKCGRTQPCNHCIKSGAACIYIGDRLDPENRGRITEIKEKVSSLELQLQQSVVVQQQQKHRSGDPAAYTLNSPCSDRTDGVDGMAAWATAGADHDLEINGRSVLDLAYEHTLEDGEESNYEHDAQATDDMIDLGFKMGRMRVTERTGVLGRLRTDEAGSHADHTACIDNGADTCDYRGPIPDFLRPSPSYMDPASGVLFDPCIAIPPVQKLLPSVLICDFLKDTYFTHVYPVAPCLHRPTFEQHYDAFFDLVSRGLRPRRTLQALVFAVLFSGVVAASSAEIDARFDVEKLDLVENLKYSVEASLGKTNLLRTASIEVMQALVIYLITICRDEVSRAHSVLVGTAICMAECMGLHRDGSSLGLTPLTTHVRRLVWHQLCFLDLRTSEAQAARPMIRRESYDTSLPYNCNDNDLVAETDASSFTPETVHATAPLSILRFEVSEMVRTIWHDRLRLQTHRSHLPIIVAKIDAFNVRLNNKYGDCVEGSTPIKQYTNLLLELFVCRMYVTVLHPYHAAATQPLPGPLHTCLIQNALRIVEIGMALETRAEFSQWRWYHGALVSYQPALLLVFEALQEPASVDTDRIGRCLDYVFGTNPAHNLHNKANNVLAEAMKKIAIYDAYRRKRTFSTASRPNQFQPPTVQALAGQKMSLPTTPQQTQWVSPKNEDGAWHATVKRSPRSDESSFSSQSSPPSPAAKTLRLMEPPHEVIMEDASAARGLALSSYQYPLFQSSVGAREPTQLQHRQQLYAQWQHYQSLQEGAGKEIDLTDLESQSGTLPFSIGSQDVHFLVASRPQQEHLPSHVPPPTMHPAEATPVGFSGISNGGALYYEHLQSGSASSSGNVGADWPAGPSVAISSLHPSHQRYQQHLQHPQHQIHPIGQGQHAFFVPAGSVPAFLGEMPMNH